MTDENKKTPLIANALVWAALMIATSLILADVGEVARDKIQFLVLLQIVGWLTTSQLITKGGRSAREEWNCLKRRFAGK